MGECPYCGAKYISLTGNGHNVRLTRSTHFNAACKRLETYYNDGRTPPRELVAHHDRLSVTGDYAR
jgi:hypothetical protein